MEAWKCPYLSVWPVFICSHILWVPYTHNPMYEKVWDFLIFKFMMCYKIKNHKNNAVSQMWYLYFSYS